MRRRGGSVFGTSSGWGRGGRALLAAGLVLLAGCRADARPAAANNPRAESSAPAVSSPAAAQSTAAAKPSSVRTGVGFRSRQRLDEHFAKHGSEFRGMSKEEYLLAAQTLRDSPVGGDIEEIVRSDGTTSRFDRASGAFIAFDRDGTIRTFFKPNDGERYFRRQAERSH